MEESFFHYTTYNRGLPLRYGRRPRENKLITFPALFYPAPDSKRAGVHREEFMKQYDTTFIIDSTLDQQQREKLIERFENSVQKLGGTVNRVVRWGMREFAYAINKQSRGYYVIFYYSVEPSAVNPFENQLRLNEHVLRYMTIAFDGKHPDYIRDEVKQAAETVKVDEPAEVFELETGDITVPADEDDEISDELVAIDESVESSESALDTIDADFAVDVNDADNDDTTNKGNDHAED